MIEVRRGNDRFATVAPGVQSRHSFAFGPHYDPDNLGFGALMAHNEDRLEPGAGFDRHQHRGVDIVTWVLDGTLEHEHWIAASPGADLCDGDPRGGPARPEPLGAGMAQLLRTGTGVDHAEHASAAPGAPGAHYVQMWIASVTPEAEPAHQRHDFTAALAAAGSHREPRSITVASGQPGRAGRSDGAPLRLGQPAAELSVARLPPGAELELPSAPLVHLFLARGVVTLADGPTLDAGDALRLRAAPRQRLRAVEAGEILIWRL